MEEIIPFIEDAWLALNKEDVQVTCLNIDGNKIKSLLIDIMDSSYLVLSCFTPEIFQFASFIRNKLKLNHRFIVHLHNQATIACWPMRKWGSPLLFRKNDIFVSSCRRDADCLKVTFPDAKVVVVPFSFRSLTSDVAIPRLPLTEPVDLFFAGRFSSQKNLHILIISLHLLKKNSPHLKWKMNFYGYQDDLGSPNMGWADQDYLKILKHLVDHFGLSDSIFFHGFVAREELAKIINASRKIFVAPSLHSDENFGMAAFRCLVDGHFAVISDWGGHVDLKENFKDQVELTDVYRSQYGPFINPSNLASKIKSTIEKYNSIQTQEKVPVYYSLQSIVAQKAELLRKESQKNETDEVLNPSAVADTIFYKDRESEMKIFGGYADSLAHHFFSAYGMKDDVEYSHGGDSQISLFPWTIENQDQFFVHDPHRGQIIFPKSEEHSLFWLLKNGFAYQVSNE